MLHQNHKPLAKIQKRKIMEKSEPAHQKEHYFPDEEREAVYKPGKIS